MSFFDRLLSSLEGIFGGRGDKVDESRDEDIQGWYLSGLQYNRNVGVTIFGDLDIDEAESMLREYASQNIQNYNDDFYGIAEIDYNGETLDEVDEVNL